MYPSIDWLIDTSIEFKDLSVNQLKIYFWGETTGIKYLPFVFSAFW